MLLKVDNLSKYFFGVPAVDTLDFEVEQGELVGLIGPNGSGKTTLFNCISGALRAEKGRVKFREANLTTLQMHEIARLGISRTFQEVRIFASLTVMENMLVSVQDFQSTGQIERIANTGKVRRLEEDSYNRASVLLERVSLLRYKDTPASNLSYGQRKLLGLVSALMCDPVLFLLDEPAAGVNLTTIETVKQLIGDLQGMGMTILLVEHNMDVVMGLCPRIIVMDYGRKIAEGTPEDIKANEQVLEAYFGR